eukprot:877457-Pyramimonas_sp.AAC.1
MGFSAAVPRPREEVARRAWRVPQSARRPPENPRPPASKRIPLFEYPYVEDRWVGQIRRLADSVEAVGE